jgi:acyl-CoA hydrolase
VLRDPNWRSKAVSASDAVQHLKSGDRVFVHGAGATPTELLEAACARTDLEGAELYHLHTNGPASFAEPSAAGRLHSNSLFIGPPLRKAVDEGRADFVPIFLSDIPSLFCQGTVPLDVALLSLSRPDRQGNCTLGTSIDAARAAADSARLIVAEINERMPRTHGNTVVPLDRVHAFMLTDRPLWEVPPAPQSDVERRIGEIVAGLIEDGSTLQMGIGGIPDAVLSRLHDKHDLGVHTEMFSDGLIDLIEGGVITNRFKEVHRGRTVTSFVNGTARLYQFVDDNLLLEFHPCDRTNDPGLIRLNPKVVAINSAIEVDLTGQVCADSIGHRVYSGIGGQMEEVTRAQRRLRAVEDGFALTAGDEDQLLDIRVCLDTDVLADWDGHEHGLRAGAGEQDATVVVAAARGLQDVGVERRTSRRAARFRPARSRGGRPLYLCNACRRGWCS